MTDISRQAAIGAAVALILTLGANSDAGVRPDGVSAAAMRQEAQLVLCKKTVRASAPDRLVIILHGSCARVAKVFVDMRNEALDAAFDAAGNLIAHFKQL